MLLRLFEISKTFVWSPDPKNTQIQNARHHFNYQTAFAYSFPALKQVIQREMFCNIPFYETSLKLLYHLVYWTTVKTRYR